ncbi:MAG: bacillithiol biosynthesis cysteine-adding enzyme BshC [Bryobacter sp.]|nr:bacillithiol biosynthesis cysteine-adding enzyme BshC [Bryobacter sp.]
MTSPKNNGVCIRHSELPGASRLFVDYLYDYPRVAAWYEHDPSDFANLRRAAEAVEYPQERRAALVEALREINGESEALQRLAQPGTVAILTGQQVGLYGGPAYTLYKGLTAIHTARELTAAGIEAVPVFWLATEDHDVEEVRSALFFEGAVEAQAAPDERPAGLHTLAGLPQDLPLGPLGGEAAALAQRHYQNGATFGSAFLGFLRELLAPYGLLFADPLSPALRQLGAPLLAAAAQQAAELSPLLAERNAELEARGYHAQVHFEPEQTSLFFLLREGKRQAWKFDGKRFHAGQESYSPEEFARFGPALSPNALLRPVWQDWMFPTAALVGGPGELAYFAQSEVLYKRLLGRMPVMLPRAFFTVADANSASLAQRYRLPYSALLRSEADVELALSQRLIPPPLLESLDDAERRINRAFGDLEANLAAFDPTLVAAAKKSQDKIRYQFAKNKRKIVAEVFRKSEQAQRHAEHLSHRLAPGGHLQERSYSLAAMLGEFGMDFPQFILDNIHSGCHDHHVLVLG